MQKTSFGHATAGASATARRPNHAAKPANGFARHLPQAEPKAMSAKEKHQAVNDLRGRAARARREDEAGQRAAAKLLAEENRLAERIRHSAQARIEWEAQEAYLLGPLRRQFGLSWSEHFQPAKMEEVQPLPPLLEQALDEAPMAALEKIRLPGQKAQAVDGAQALRQNLAPAMAFEAEWRRLLAGYLEHGSQIAGQRQRLDQEGIYVDWLWAAGGDENCLQYFRFLENSGANWLDLMRAWDMADPMQVMSLPRLVQLGQKFRNAPVRRAFEARQDESRAALNRLLVAHSVIGKEMEQAFSKVEVGVEAEPEAGRRAEAAGELAALRQRLRSVWAQWRPMLQLLQELDARAQASLMDMQLVADGSGGWRAPSARELNEAFKQYSQHCAWPLNVQVVPSAPGVPIERCLRRLARPGERMAIEGLDGAKYELVHLKNNPGIVRLRRADSQGRPAQAWLECLETELETAGRLADLDGQRLGREKEAAACAQQAQQLGEQLHRLEGQPTFERR